MDSGGLETGEVISSQDLNGQLKNLGMLYSEFEALIPTEGLKAYEGGLNGRYGDRQKAFNAETALTSTQKTLNEHFPKESDQAQILDAANIFIQDIASNLHIPKRLNEETSDFGKLDRFLAGFPANMIDRLGNLATVETMVGIFQIGSRIIERRKQGEKEYLEPVEKRDEILLEYRNGTLANAALLVAEAIPSALAHAGANYQVVLDKFNDFASKLDSHQMQNLVEYYQNIKELNPQDQERISQFETTFRRIDPELGTRTNPFNRPDREPWINRRSMGQEKRVPTWADLGDMIRATEQDNREYGILISQDSDGDIPNLEYLRGSERSVHNGERRSSFKQNVFIHVHPSTTPEQALNSPLISTGDLTATMMQDYGGGYYNVVTTSGITLHVGSLSIENGRDSSDNTDVDSPGIIYTVESGQFKGSRIAPTETTEEHLDLMGRLKATEQPYVYSIYDVASELRYYFVHIPWGYINPEVKVEDIVFGDGLPKLLPETGDLPDILRPANLRQAMRNTNTALHESFARRTGREI